MEVNPSLNDSPFHHITIAQSLIGLKRFSEARNELIEARRYLDKLAPTVQVQVEKEINDLLKEIEKNEPKN